jgi:sRNA-binding regulator protein Hfq
MHFYYIKYLCLFQGKINSYDKFNIFLKVIEKIELN